MDEALHDVVQLVLTIQHPLQQLEEEVEEARIKERSEVGLWRCPAF